MSYHLLGDTPNQNMRETGEPVRGCNDQIDIMNFCKGADINDRRSIGKRRFKFDGPEVQGAHEIAHSAFGSLAGSLLHTGNVVEGSAFCGIDVSEIRRMQQNDLGPEFIRERNRVSKTFP